VVAAVGSLVRDNEKTIEAMAEDTAPHTKGERTIIIVPRRLFQPGVEAYRCKLEAPTFTGVQDVEQFISEYNETLTITQWLP